MLVICYKHRTKVFKSEHISAMSTAMTRNSGHERTENETCKDSLQEEGLLQFYNKPSCMPIKFYFYKESIIYIWISLEQTEEKIGIRTSSKACVNISPPASLQSIKMMKR